MRTGSESIKGRSPHWRPRRSALALELRMLFDGAAAATVEQQQDASSPLPDFQDVTQQPADTQSVAADVQVQPGTAEISESSLADVVTLTPQTATESETSPTDSAITAPTAPTHELVFIDPRVPDAGQLLADLTTQTDAERIFEIVFLDVNRSGIDQVSEALAGRTEIDAIHFLTHGNDATLLIGNTWLDAQTLAANAAEVASWGQALSENADILLYACDLVSSANGESYIEQLAQLTGADVAASTDSTGAESLGGDWVLEASTGNIEAQIAISAIEQADWNHILAVPTYVGAGALTEGTGTISPALPSHLRQQAGLRRKAPVPVSGVGVVHPEK